ncbi:MAG: PEP-CTERM sorting domain-containing protein [Phycisphaeraceae bacterium]|nr:PEP-CTERM sorting domain-containing protein [Phycisphaeraceae bacterium]MCW5753735.1 PEP-CTERM sorting domain-containing protein [Phycisphaeraceae bacterium]
MKKIVSVGLVAALAGIASAQQFSATWQSPATLDRPSHPESAIGDSYDAALTIFGTGGAYLDSGSATFGSLSTLNGSVIHMNSTETTVGNIRTYTIEWSHVTGGTFITAGTTVGGTPVTQMGFEIGENNAGTDFVNDPEYQFPLHVFDSGRYRAQFQLFNTGGTDLFGGAGTFFVLDQGAGNGFSGIVFVSAGGTNLGTFDIARAVATIQVQVPAPGSLALLGLGGLAAIRRRR